MTQKQKRYVQRQSKIKMSNQKYNRLMNDMSVSFSQTNHIPCVLTTTGELGRTDGNTCQINIGISEKDIIYETSAIGIKHSYVSDYDVIDHIRAFYHEERHCEQRNTSFNASQQVKEDITCARIAGLDDGYYWKHYFELADEIDAECYAMNSPLPCEVFYGRGICKYRAFSILIRMYRRFVSATVYSYPFPTFRLKCCACHLSRSTKRLLSVLPEYF